MNSLSNIEIAALVQAYDEELRRVMTRRCGCIDTAADIVQETYQRMLSGNLWQQAENPRALLHRIAANLAVDYERRAAVRNRHVTSENIATDWVAEIDSRQPDAVLANQQRLQQLSVAIEALPPKCRTVFMLRKFDGLSHAEIAERLAISRNMVEKHLRHALTVLHQLDDE